MLPRSRIWQLIETGALDFTLSGIDNPERDKFAVFAWYMSNKYYLLVRRDAEVRSVAEFRRKRALRLGLIRSFRYGDSANLMVADELEGEAARHLCRQPGSAVQRSSSTTTSRRWSSSRSTSP